MCLQFLLSLYKSNLSYSSINTARSALSCIFDDPPIGDEVMIKRFMRSVFIKRPNVPRYEKIWDVSLVLNYLEKVSPCKSLNLQQLTFKLLMLIALTTGQRCQSLCALDLKHSQISNNSVNFKINTLLKHNRPNNCRNVVSLVSYPVNRRLCVITYLKEYIKRTKSIRSDSRLFLSLHRPHKPVTASTLGRWIRLVLGKSGVNTKIFKAHSTRAAATSAAAKNLDTSIILKTAGWSNASTFAKYYNKPIITKKKSNTFGHAVLNTL